MGKKLNDDILKFIVDIDGKPAQNGLNLVEKEVRKLERSNRELVKEMAKLEAHGKKGSVEWKKYDAQLKQNNASIKVLKNRQEALRKEVGIGNLTVKQLKQEYRRLKQAQDGADPNSKEWKRYSGQLKAVRNRLSQLNGAQKRTNALFGQFRLLIPSLGVAGLVMGFQRATEVSNNYGESLANLSALTELTGKKLKWLSDKAKDFAGSTTDDGIRITQSAQEIVDAYTKMGSARPELLKNKEALVEVTEQALILAAASKMELEPAIDAVAAVMNQFNLPASEANRVINALGAGSLAGSAEVDHLTLSMKNAGTVAASSNMSLEQTIAVLEILGEKQLKSAEGGTKLRGALLKMKKAGVGYISGQFNFRDALIEVNEQLAAKSSALERDALKQKVFGAENITAGEILIQNINAYDRLTIAVTGTNVATEQALKNTSTNKAKLEAERKALNKHVITLGEKLAPAQLAAAKGQTVLIKGLVIGVNFLTKYGKQILIAAAGIAIYYTAVKLAAYWDAIHYAYLTTKTAVTAAYGFAVDVLNGKITIAILRQKAWNLVQKMNPIGLLVGLLMAAGVALALYTRKLSAAEKAQKELNDITNAAQKAIVGEKVEMQNLLRIARDEKLSKEARIRAIKKLNEISPEYLGGLTLEKINTEEATTATENYITALLKKAEMQAANNRLIEIEEELNALNLEGKGAELSWWQKTKVAVLSFGDASTAVGKTVLYNLENQNQKEADLLELKTKLLAKIQEINREEDNSLGNNNIDPSGDSTKKVMTEIEVLGYERSIAELDRYLKQLEYYRDKAEDPITTEVDLDIEDEATYLIEKFKKTLEGRRQLTEQAYNMGLISRAEYNDQIAVFDQEEKDFSTATLKEKAAFAIHVAQQIAAVMQTISNAANQNDQNELNTFKDTQDQKKKLLQDQLKDGLISREVYDAQIDAMDMAVEKKEREMANKKAKRDKETALFNAIISTAQAIVQSLPNYILAGLAAATGAVQVGVIASTKVPEYEKGNVIDIIGKNTGKKYRTTISDGRSGIYSKPTYVPGLNGIVGEKDPELVLSGAHTRNIQNNYPELMDAIAGTMPEYANGNISSTVTNNTYEKTFTDPVLLAIMHKLNERLDEPILTNLIADENYLRTHNKKQTEYEAFKKRVD